MATIRESVSSSDPPDIYVSGTITANSGKRTWQAYVGDNIEVQRLQVPNRIQRATLDVLLQADASLLCIGTPQSGKSTAVLISIIHKMEEWKQTGHDSTTTSSPIVFYIVSSATRAKEIEDRLHALRKGAPLTVVTFDGAPTTRYQALSTSIDVLIATREATTNLLNSKQIRVHNARLLVYDITDDAFTQADAGKLRYISSKLEESKANLATAIIMRQVPTASVSVLTALLPAARCIITTSEIGRLHPTCTKSQATMRLPPNVAGCLIGAGGTLLQKLQRETQCGIDISRAAWDGSQLVTFRGIPEAINFARARCDRVFLQKGAKIKRKFAFPPTLYDAVRGSDNYNLKQINLLFGVFADMKAEDRSEYKSMCTLELTGFPCALRKATAYLSNINRDNEASVYEEQVDVMQVPTSAKQSILGEQGRTLKGLQTFFNVFLTFVHAKKTPDNIPLSIRGLPQSVDKVRTAVSNIIRSPTEAAKYTLKQTSSTPSWPNKKSRVAPIDSNAFDPTAYAPPKKFFVVTHKVRNAKYGRCNESYSPVATGQRTYESLFDKISTTEGLMDIQVRIEICERDIARATSANDTDRLLTLQVALLEYCACLMEYLTEEQEAREIPSESEVLWLRSLPTNFGYAEVQELFQTKPFDALFHRRNPGDLAAAASCLVIFRKPADAQGRTDASSKALKARQFYILDPPPSFDYFYRAYTRRILTLRAILNGATVASQALRHSMLAGRRRQLAYENKEKVQANLVLETAVFEYSETIPAEQLTADQDEYASSATAIVQTTSSAPTEEAGPSAFATAATTARKERVVHALSGFKHVVRTLVRQLIAPASIPGKSKVESRDIRISDFLLILERLQRKFGKSRSLKNALREAEEQVAKECREKDERPPDINVTRLWSNFLYKGTMPRSKVENPKKPAPGIWAIPTEDHLLFVNNQETLKSAIAIALKFEEADIIAVDAEWCCLSNTLELIQCSGRNTTLVVDVQLLQLNPLFWRLIDAIFSSKALLFVLGVEDRESSTGKYISTTDRSVLTKLLETVTTKQVISESEAARITSVVAQRPLIDIRHLVHMAFQEQFERDPGCRYLRQNPRLTHMVYFMSGQLYRKSWTLSPFSVRPLLQAQIEYSWADAVSLVKLAKFVRARNRKVYDEVTAVRDRNQQYACPVVKVHKARKKGLIGIGAVTQDFNWRQKRSETNEAVADSGADDTDSDLSDQEYTDPISDSD